MNPFIDVHTVLATPEDLDDWHDDPFEATEKLNVMLHHLADGCVDDDSSKRFDNLCQQVWEHWHKDPHLVDIDESDLTDWVDHQLASWDDAEPKYINTDDVPE